MHDMALDGLLQGTPEQLLHELEAINAGVGELARVHGAKPDPYTWTGWLELWGVEVSKVVLKLDLLQLLGHSTRGGSIRIPGQLPGVIPAPAKIVTSGSLGTSSPWLVAAGETYEWDWPVDHLFVYPGAEELAWPAPTYLTIRAWRIK